MPYVCFQETSEVVMVEFDALIINFIFLSPNLFLTMDTLYHSPSGSQAAIHETMLSDLVNNRPLIRDGEHQGRCEGCKEEGIQSVSY